ncbi:MAG: accessory factor UbiK family protein, partial [Acetobacteraceae bacterium]
REEVEGMVRSGVDEALARLELVRRADLDAVEELARAAREGETAAAARLAALEARLAALESRLARDEAATADPPG